MRVNCWQTYRRYGTGIQGLLVQTAQSSTLSRCPEFHDSKKIPKLYLDKTKVNLLWINPIGFLLLLNLKIGIGAEVIPTQIER